MSSFSIIACLSLHVTAYLSIEFRFSKLVVHDHMTMYGSYSARSLHVDIAIVDASHSQHGNARYSCKYQDACPDGLQSF